MIDFDANTNIPQSIAIIMDGNGRYAKKKLLSTAFGHKAGCDNLEIILEECVRIGIKYLTAYAFSTENWKREKEEIDSLMSLFKLYLPRIKQKALKNGVRVHFIGNIYIFNKDLVDDCLDLMETTKEMTKCNFIIAFNYGGRDEIIRATNKIIEYKNTHTDFIVDEDSFKSFLDTSMFPDPDLIIRTSGEYRISNFLLWQCAYSEFYFTDCLWPEFNIDELKKSIISYNNRKRRFGAR